MALCTLATHDACKLQVSSIFKGLQLQTIGWHVITSGQAAVNDGMEAQQKTILLGLQIIGWCQVPGHDLSIKFSSKNTSCLSN